MMGMSESIIAKVTEEKDVEEGGPFDHGRLQAIENIIEERWKYLHCPYHSVGFLLHPKNHGVDLTSDKIAPLHEELMDDFATVCTRLHGGDSSLAAKAIEQFNTYKKPEYFIGAMGSIRKKLARNENMKPWDFYDSVCAGMPELAKVARRVLSKQIGVGAVERSHKAMKNISFDKTRANLRPEIADRDLYTLLNNRALSRLEKSTIPDWVEHYSEDVMANIAVVEDADEAAAVAPQLEDV